MKSFIVTFILSVSLISYSQVNNVLELSGAYSYANGSSMNNLGTGNFTIEAWIFVDKITHPANKIINKGLSSAGYPSNAGYGIRVGSGDKNTVDFSIGGKDGEIYRVKYESLEHNKWYHLAGVRDGDMIHLYVNGKLVGSKNTGKVLNVDTDLPFTIGAIDKGWRSSTNEFFDGMIDEVRVWKMARSKKEIQSMKDSTLNKPVRGLWASYTMDDDGGTVLSDQSGVGNDLKIHGSVYRVDQNRNRTVTTATEIVDDEEIEELDIEFVEIMTDYDIVYSNDDKTIEVTGSAYRFQYVIFNIDGKMVKKEYYARGTKISVEDLEKGSYYFQFPIYMKDDMIKFEIK